MGGEPMTSVVVSVSNLELSRGERRVLRGLTLGIARGDRIALMGLSGGGKSTVLRTMVALEAFDSGRIDVDGFALSPGPVPKESRLRELRRRIGIVFQFHHLFAHLTVLQNVMLAQVHVLRRPRVEAEQRARTLLDSLGVGHRIDARPAELSGGEAQRVAIARALAMDPPVLLMDEPTASLDPARRSDLADSLVALAKAGRTLVFATHDVAFAKECATRVVVLADGQVVEDGPPEQVLVAPVHPSTRALLKGSEA